jgi:hypothetical protein
MRDNYDDEDDDLSIRHETPFPSSVRAAGVIWIVIGALILFNAAVQLLVTVASASTPQGGGAYAVGGMCVVILLALFGAAFIFVGVQTARGTAQDTLGNAIGSIIFGLLNGGSGIVFIASGLTRGGGAGAVLVIAGLVSAIATIALVVAGIVALMGRENYKAWRRANSPRRRRD